MTARADGPPLPHPERAVPARPGYDLPFLAILFAMMLLAALVMTRLVIFGFELFVRDADMSTDPTPVEVTVGGVALFVPLNTIRFGAERGGTVRKLDLHLHWPSLEGFSAERAQLFQTSNPESPVVYVTIEAADQTMSPRDRFRQVYPRVLSEDVRQSPEGYVVRRFRFGHGYDDEELYIARDPTRPLAARCESADSPSGGTCIAEFRSELGLDVVYRFQRALLGDWRGLDAGLRDLIDQWARPRD